MAVVCKKNRFLNISIKANIGNIEIKISLLADDMTLLLQNLTSVNNVLLNTIIFPQML